MQLIKYTFEGKTFTNIVQLGNWVRQQTGVSFANPTDEEGWIALGVTITKEEIEEPVPVEPTEEEKQVQIQKELTEKVQEFLDTEAKKLNYDSCLSVCSYVNTGVQKFDDEGEAFRKWRSAVWAKGYEIVAAVKAGERGVPTEEELFAELPSLSITYSVTE